MLVPEPTFVGGKLLIMLIFDNTNSKSVERFCRFFNIVELSQNFKLKLCLLTRLIGQVKT